ncbi:TIGR00269 family protein [Candidatus Woesearchaeota archaeon]|nr:TIGR00269 family protein [Candidatus Woesearchaeota archaeon]
MKCVHCSKPAVIGLQHGALCKIHFIDYFEDKVIKTMNKYQMIERKDNICVATSGGKDSLTVLYLTKKYCEKYDIPLTKIRALAVDEGIAQYREKTLIDLQKFCKEQAISLEVVSFEQELGKTLDEAYPLINKSAQKKPCNVCGVWRRYLLNKYAAKSGASKVITGHNLDDEAQVIIMNIFKANTKLTGRLGPISGIECSDYFIQRVKPLYFCTEKEVRLYAFLKKFQVEFTECPYSKEGFRHQVQAMLNDFEERYRGTKQGVINSFLALLPQIREQEKGNVESVRECARCGEAANKEVCNACQMKEMISHD